MKISIILIVLNLSLFGSSLITKVDYEGGISLFGKVAEANITLEQDPEINTYNMKIVASSTGIVKALTANRKDTFISEGNIIDGVYRPKKFTEITTKNGYFEKTLYTFEYKKERVLKETFLEEIVTENSYDIINLKKISKQKLVKSNDKKYIKLQPNDYISMFLNLSVGKLNIGELRYIDQKESDKVLLLTKNIFEVIKHNGAEKYRIIFYKKNELFFDKAVAEDIAFYGDAYLKKIVIDSTFMN